MKDFSDELRVTGEYRVPGIYGATDSIVPKYNFPITPKENMVRMLKGEKPLWVPNQILDNNAVQPLVMPDARARNFGGYGRTRHQEAVRDRQGERGDRLAGSGGD